MEDLSTAEQPPTGNEKAPKENKCRDCTHHNSWIEEARKSTGIKGSRRPTDHKMGAKHCPTLLSIKKKALPLRPQHPEASTQATE